MSIHITSKAFVGSFWSNVTVGSTTSKTIKQISTGFILFLSLIKASCKQCSVIRLLRNYLCLLNAFYSRNQLLRNYGCPSSSPTCTLGTLFPISTTPHCTQVYSYFNTNSVIDAFELKTYLSSTISGSTLLFLTSKLV